jgi:hypothetical protein
LLPPAPPADICTEKKSGGNEDAAIKVPGYVTENRQGYQQAQKQRQHCHHCRDSDLPWPDTSRFCSAVV